MAALSNPTVRLRYLRAREVLLRYGYPAVYAEMLRLLGCTDLTPERAMEHLEALAQTFDTAAAVLRTPYRFGSDISPAARPIAIDGSRALIQAGNHREAVFYMVVTFGRCHAILTVDAPEAQRALAPAFDALLADLGLPSTADLIRRADEVRRFLPSLSETAEAILAARV